MIRFLSLMVLLLFASGAIANFGPPYVPKDYKLVEPPVRFEGVDKYSEHAFYLYFSAPYYGSKLVEVKNGEPIKLSFGSGGNRYPDLYAKLLTLERKDFEARKMTDPSLKWLAEEKKGILSADLDAPKSIAPVTTKEVPVSVYRVTLKDGKLSAEKIAPQKGAAAPTSLLPPSAVGLVMSFSLVWLGLWFARGKNRRTN